MRGLARILPHFDVQRPFITRNVEGNWTIKSNKTPKERNYAQEPTGSGCCDGLRCGDAGARSGTDISTLQPAGRASARGYNCDASSPSSSSPSPSSPPRCSARRKIVAPFKINTTNRTSVRSHHPVLQPGWWLVEGTRPWLALHVTWFGVAILPLSGKADLARTSEIGRS